MTDLPHPEAAAAAAGLPADRSAASAAASRIGVVAIGRNEGERLVRCLDSALRQGAAAVVYVDSGSTDGSADEARGMGCEVVDLDMTRPFTAARARNVGWRRLPKEATLVQFVDGDCEVADGWLEKAAARLAEDPGLAGVAGRLRERFPDASPYNKLCDLEWACPPGETAQLGGVSMFRREALERAGGFDDGLIAGEEPEMCLRMREKGWRFWRLGDDMGFHDADMHRFGQWWKRAVRCGHAHAEVSAMHAASDKRIWARESRSTAAWAVGPPLLAAGLCVLLAFAVGWPWLLAGLLPLGLYGLLFAKVARSRLRGGDDPRTAALYAGNVTLAKFPQFLGQRRYRRNARRGERSTIIEHRAAAA